jgi:LysM repeat protein
VYIVKPNDTLSAISIRAKISIDNLVKWNNIKNPNVLDIGQVLKLKAPAVKKPISKPVSYKTIKIVSGDTLSELAEKYKSSVSELKKLNNLKSDMIYVGQKLKVPANGSAKISVSSDKKYHTVVSGDNLWDIANKYKTTVDKIKKLNNLKSDLIYPNQKLRVK